jgi:Tfp pilus assembly protein PilF
VKQSILWALIGVIVLGFALRAANLADLSDSPFFTRPVIDGQVYDHWAMDIVHAKAPRAPFYQDPLYPYFLAVIYRVFGHSFWAVYVMQLLLGVVLLGLVFDLTRRLFDARAGAIAALLAALYRPFIFYESQIEKTGLAVFLVALFLWALVRGLSARRAVWPLLAGLFLGLAALTRANLLLFAPLLFVVFLLRRNQDRKTRLRAALLALGGVVLVIAPVSIRNSVLAREFVLTTTQAGQNFYIGNSEYNRTGQSESPPWVRPHPDFEETDFRDYAVKVTGRNLTAGEVSRFYIAQALGWITAHPGNFLRLLVRKTALYFNNYEGPDNQDLYFFARYSWVLRLPLLGFGILFALGLPGVLLLRGRTVTRLSLIVFFFGYAASVVVFFVYSRYRLPSLPGLMPFSGGMAVWLWNRAKAGRTNHQDTKPALERPDEILRFAQNDGSEGTPRNHLRSSAFICGSSNVKCRVSNAKAQALRLGGGVVLVVACLAPTLYPLHQGSGAREAAQSLTNLASSYLREGDTNQAVATLEEALKLRPGYAEALRDLGTIAFTRRQPVQAHELLTRAVASEPGNPVTHHYLGKVHEQQQNLDSAYGQYRLAVNLAPDRVEYRSSLATILQKLGANEAALGQYDTMTRLDPQNPAIHHNYSVALYIAGRLNEAWQEYETARRLGQVPSPEYEQILRQGLGR